MADTNIEKVIDEVFELYEKHGSDDYIGEKISQVEHMAQSAQLAEKLGYNEEVILAAFFHDIGHLVEHATDANNMGGYGIKEHEKLGADFLRAKGFSEKVAQLVKSHVQAKRYLTFADKDYYEQLSEASKKTLEYQGGRMTEDEARQFEADELFELKIQMRKWDELAKEENMPLPDMNVYKEIARRVLAQSRR